MEFAGFDHIDARVRSLAAVEAFYDALLPELGLPRKTRSFVDAEGEWHSTAAGEAYNVAEYYEAEGDGAPRFLGIIEDAAMTPVLTRIAFRAPRGELAAWAGRLQALGARNVETSEDMEAYPAVFFEDAVGTKLEICARRVS
jgi:catechol 2,3-dioxygenase-like lactoylglutathione lyase family enzyme